MVAIVDDEDYAKVNQYKWCVTRNSHHRTHYAMSRSLGCWKSPMKMHRLIMGCTDSKQQIDHINGNGLDNRKCNLRICTNRQNHWNTRKQRGNYTSQFIGVSWDKRRSKWEAYICPNNKKRSLGFYSSEIIAASVRDKAVKKIAGSFAKLNLS